MFYSGGKLADLTLPKLVARWQPVAGLAAAAGGEAGLQEPTGAQPGWGAVGRAAGQGVGAGA